MTNRQISPHTASFEKIFREYYPVLLPFVERHVGERELAKDLVQDVFLKLYKSYPYFSSEVNIKSWLYTSSRNAALDYLRHLKVRDNNKLLMAEAMMYAADVDEVISEELTARSMKLSILTFAVLPDRTYAYHRWKEIYRNLR